MNKYGWGDGARSDPGVRVVKRRTGSESGNKGVGVKARGSTPLRPCPETHFGRRAAVRRPRCRYRGAPPPPRTLWRRQKPRTPPRRPNPWAAASARRPPRQLSRTPLSRARQSPTWRACRPATSISPGGRGVAPELCPDHRVGDPSFIGWPVCSQAVVQWQLRATVQQQAAQQAAE